MTAVIRKTPYLSYGVFLAILTIIICYLLRPRLLNPHVAFSSLGAYPPTSYIFNIGFVLVAVLLFLDMLNTLGLLQKLCRLFAAIGFAMLGVFQIEHGQLRGNIHRYGGLIMLISIIVSMIASTITQSSNSTIQRKIMSLLFTGLGILSVIMSILSSSQVKVSTLEGLAQYIGLASLVGWAMLDKAEV